MLLSPIAVPRTPDAKARWMSEGETLNDILESCSTGAVTEITSLRPPALSLELPTLRPAPLSLGVSTPKLHSRLTPMKMAPPKLGCSKKLRWSAMGSPSTRPQAPSPKLVPRGPPSPAPPPPPPPLCLTPSTELRLSREKHSARVGTPPLRRLSTPPPLAPAAGGTVPSPPPASPRAGRNSPHPCRLMAGSPLGRVGSIESLHSPMLSPLGSHLGSRE